MNFLICVQFFTSINRDKYWPYMTVKASFSFLYKSKSTLELNNLLPKLFFAGLMWYFQIARETGLYCNWALSTGGVTWQWDWENLSLSLHLKRQGTCSDEVYKYHCGWSETAKMHWPGREGVAVRLGDEMSFLLIFFIKERIHFTQQMSWLKVFGRHCESLVRTSVNHFWEEREKNRLIKRKGTAQHQRDVYLRATFNLLLHVIQSRNKNVGHILPLRAEILFWETQMRRNYCYVRLCK